MRRQHQAADSGPEAMGYFILVLIGKMGLKSLYALRNEAGLEPGGIRSSIEHLEELALITRAAPGKYSRRDLALTPAGRELLADSWMNCLQEHADSESVLRSTWVALVMGNSETAAFYIQGMGEKRQLEARETMMKAEHSERSQKDPLSIYQWMRISNQAHRRSAEAEAFLSISRSLRERSRKDVQQPLSTSSS